MEIKLTNPRYLLGKRLLLLMKTLIFLCCTTVFGISSKTSFSQEIIVVEYDQMATADHIFQMIRQQTDYKFVYPKTLFRNTPGIWLEKGEIKAEALLKRITKQVKVDIEIRGNRTIIIKKREKDRDFPMEVQQLEIGGTVTAATDHNPLPGVNIVVEGTSNGTTTDFDGNYHISGVPHDATLIFSYLGFESQKVKVNGQNTIDLVMRENVGALEEVVVVGYGEKTQGAITGAISTVTSEVFESRPMNNSFEALQGTLPGVTITRNSGKPGDQGYNLQIRGYSSINGNAPLVLIDGIPGDLSVINPSDIDKISVLKDAAAAIYGARAADGVILVTTRKGKKGKPEVSYSTNIGLKTPTYLRKTMNTLHFAEFLDEGLRNAGMDGFPDEVFEKIRSNAQPDLNEGWNYNVTNYPGFYGNTNWNDVIYRNAIQQTHNLSVSGGGEYSNYLLSLGYTRDNGTVSFGENNSDRYNLRINYGLELSDKLQLQTRTHFDHQVTRTPSLINSALTNVTRQFPYQPVYNPEGMFYGYQGYENPAQYLEEGGQRTTNYSRFTTNFMLDYELFEGLKITGQASFEFGFYADDAHTRTITRYNYEGGVQDIRNMPNSAYYTNQKTLKKLYQGYLNYDRDISDDHNISVTLGASLEQHKNDGQTTNGYNFLSNDIFTLNLADKTDAAFADFTGYLNRSALSSYFGRFSYSYKNKYILDITARADGSSKFAPDKRYSELFPSAALAYNLSEESFIRDLDIFDQLKLRVSWGKTGNQEIGELGLFDYIPLISIGGNYPLGFPNTGVTGATANTTSADRTWETIINKNIGMDMTLLDSRLSFSFDYFNKANDNMLVDIAVPATFGGTPPSINQGKLVTKGFDASLQWRDKTGDFSYGISMQLSDSKNELIELKNSDNYGEGLNFVREGYSINSYFGYVYEGIIKTEDQLLEYKKLGNVPANIGIGDVMYKDVDGDGKLTAFGDKTKGLSGDMVYLGNILPRYTFSSTIDAAYKNFDLKLFLQGVGKRTVQYGGAISTPNNFFWPSLEYYYDKTYSAERPDAPYPRYIPGSVGLDDLRNYNYRTSDLTLHNTSYLRFKVITLGYTFPEKVCETLRVSHLRIYFSGQDLFTISRGTLGDNFDPEDGYRNEGTYPFNKVYSVGLNVNF